VLRHIWKNYEALAVDACCTPKYRHLSAKRKEPIVPDHPQLLARDLREGLLAHTAQRTYKVGGQILKLRAGGNSMLRVSGGLIIFPSTYIAHILFHASSILSALLKYFSSQQKQSNLYGWTFSTFAI